MATISESTHKDLEIHAIILTLNEEKHIARCINSIKDHCTSITVVDSGSSDKTVEIASALGAVVLTNKWVNHSVQMNFGIDTLKGKGGWLLRIDADEILEPFSDKKLNKIINKINPNTKGLLIRRQISFMGRHIRYGGLEPSWILRFWKNGFGSCEQRWMDEHIIVDGEIEKSDIKLSDINLNSISWWTEKHNSYANREAIDVLNHKYEFMQKSSDIKGTLKSQAMTKRFIKERIYNKIPSGIRSFAYFIYRYFFRLGLLDGKAGWYFHFLQAFWYRTLVDAKVIEIENAAISKNISIVHAIKELTGIDPEF